MSVTSESPSTVDARAGGAFQPDERRRFFDFQRQVRGLLAIVRSIVRRMAESTASVEDFAAELEGRLGALARIQGFLLRAPDAPVDLEELVREELLSQAIPDEQFEIRGPRVLLTAHEAGTIGLALHELTTNSIKFGGRIRITRDANYSNGGAPGSPRRAPHWTGASTRSMSFPRRSTGDSALS